MLTWFGLALAAQVQIPVSGSLTSPAGHPLEGTQNLTFRLWGDASGGTATHTASHAATLTGGMFQVGLAVEHDRFADDTLWLSVEVGGVESPRVPLGAAPRAVYARIAESVGDIPAANVIHTGSTNALPWSALSTATMPAGVRDGYTAGDGVILVGTEFQVDPTWVDDRIDAAIAAYEPGLLSTVGTAISDAIDAFRLTFLDELDERYQAGGSTSATVCDTSTAGSTRFNDATLALEYCDSFAWTPLTNNRAADVTISTTRNLNNDVITAGRSAADGIAWRVTAPSDGASSVSRFNASSDFTVGLAPGDDVMVINLQGTLGDAADVGNYELRRVATVTASTVTFTAPLTRSYEGTTPANQKVALQRVPRWQNVRVQSGGTLTASTWNGLTGVTAQTGVVAFVATGLVHIDAGGKIDVRGLGYRGGSGSASGYCQYAYNGEGVNQESRALEGAANLGGGGGGSRAGSWCVLGSGGEHHAMAGGGGSHLTAGTTGTVKIAPPGSTYGDATASALRFGGAGGGSTSYRHDSGSGYGGTGGNGGGVVFIQAGSVNNLGSIDASGLVGGNHVTHGGGGGGGAGGTVRVATTSFSGTQPLANGASGGTGYSSSPGGNGGNGVVRVAP